MEQQFIGVLFIGEIRTRIEFLCQRDSDQGPAFETWLDAIRLNYRNNIISLSEPTVCEWSALMARRMRLS